MFQFYHNNEVKVFSNLIPHETQFLEFGVYTGESADIILQELTDVKFTQYCGFDSFIGLPNPQNEWIPEDWAVGSFSSIAYFSANGISEVKNLIKSKLSKHTVPIRLIDGWYKETLNQQTITEYNITKAGFVNIDVDYYSSTLEVLDFLLKHDILAKQAIIRYDDWLSGPEWQTCNSKAHIEKINEYGCLFTRLGKNIFQYLGTTKDLSFGNSII